MRLDKFTFKAQEAIAEAQNLGREFEHQQIDVEHLFLALLKQEDLSGQEGIIVPLFEKLEVSPEKLKSELKTILESRPRVYGQNLQLYLSPRLEKVLNQAFKESENLKDEFVSSEHLLLAIVEEKEGESSALLKKYGVNREKILQVLASLRGGQRVTDQNPEDKYQALQKYTRDLTDLARRGKLDPVIGRNDEIRRVIQVLSR